MLLTLIRFAPSRYCISQSQPTVIPLLHNRVLLNNVDSLDLIYPTASRYNITGCRLCIYTLHCGCALRTPYAIVPATFSTCAPHVDNMTVLHGFNLIVLQQFFFFSEELGSLVGSTLTQIEIEADLPTFKTYEHNQQEHLAVDSQLKYDLFKLSNLTRQDSTAFHSLAEFIHSDLVWYGIVEFNVPLDTVSHFGDKGAVMCISHSVMEGQRHNNPLNPRCFCLQRPKRDRTSS